jgi:hypothetical protein
VPGLARRGRALAGRQLQLLEELARDEPDPHRRRGLAGVEHLATRLRRTAETLLAMTAPDPAAGPTRPAPVAAVPRAAVAEAEPGGPGLLDAAGGAPSGGVAGALGTWSSWERPTRSRLRSTAGPGPTWSTCWPSCSTTPPPSRRRRRPWW